MRTKFCSLNKCTRVWHISYNEHDAPEIRYNYKAIITIIIMLVAYIVTVYVLNSILGCAIYCATGLLLGIALMKKSFLFVCHSIFDSVLIKLNLKNNS